MTDPARSHADTVREALEYVRDEHTEGLEYTGGERAMFAKCDAALAALDAMERETTTIAVECIDACIRIVQRHRGGSVGLQRLSRLRDDLARIQAEGPQGKETNA